MHVRILPMALVALALSLVALPALAGPNESPVQFAMNPANPDFWVVRYAGTQGGFVFSSDAGKTWQATCNDAIDGEYRAVTYSLGVASDGSVFTGDFSGLLTVTDGGCSWSVNEGIMDNWVTAFAVDAVDPTRVLASTSLGNKSNGLWAYDSATATWTAFGASEDPMFIHSFVTVKSGDGQRIYEQFNRENLPSGNPDYHIRYSEDDAATWTEYAFPEDIEGGYLDIVAVDPNEPTRIAVAHQFDGSDSRTDRLWINEQSGDSAAFVLVAEVTRFGGATFDLDGNLYYGDRYEQLYRLEPGSTTPVVVGDMLRPYCVAFDATRNALLACQFNAFGEVDPASGAYTEFLNFSSADSPISMLECGTTADVTAMCETQLASVGWCSASHWAYSALCEAYDFPGRTMIEMNQGGTGGASGTGGATATGGTTATGGEAASGGAVAMTSGGMMVTGDTPDAGPGANEVSDSTGCGCHIAPGAVGGRGPIASLALLALGVVLYRRRR